jgi:signal transduction histidine kinase
MEDDLYHIVQEALHNVVKHAQANAVQVRISARGSGKGLLVVDIDDDGVGFHRPLHSGGSLGMQSMRERAQRGGGSVVLRSRSGRGGHVRVTIPLPGDARPTPGGRGSGD